MEDNLTTLFVNETEHDLIMKVGNRSSFVPLAEVKRGCQHALRLCMNWTYQEFSLEARKLGDAAAAAGKKKLFVNSDDCCDFERITIKESEGHFVVDRVARKSQQAKPEVQAAYKWTFPWRFWLWL